MIIYDDKLFKNPIDVISAFNNEEFKEAFKKIEKYRSSHHLAGYIRYEAKEIFLGENINSELPLLYFEVFENFESFQTEQSKNISININPSISFSDYKKALTEIKNEIAEGNTYEVNYTYNFDVDCNCEPIDLYNFLLTKQKTPYNMFLQNDYDTLLSFSPELFFEIENNHITTKPMKGTIRRGKNKKEDLELISFLKNDIKNRAENVMIVDLLRNDLGRIAKTGSVNVTQLFEIETHKTLHQMTSQIEADLKENLSLFEVFQAIFPCGSITGAPKISTMEIIDRVETGKRDIYCGAIGLISPEKITLSVPIRILQKSPNDTCYKYRVGGAIVWDSDIQEEWEETITKTKFLNNDFKIVETMKIQNKIILFKDEHLNRLKKSAEYFGFNYNEDLNDLSPKRDGLLRILLSKNGELITEYKLLNEIKTNKIRVSEIKIKTTDEMIYHKTTYRPWYYDSSIKINDGEIFDEIFFNEKGELTEGSRSNIIIELNGVLFTPPITSGILNGIYRQKMLDNKECREKILYISDLVKADNIYCVNSVRGKMRVELI